MVECHKLQTLCSSLLHFTLMIAVVVLLRGSNPYLKEPHVQSLSRYTTCFLMVVTSLFILFSLSIPHWLCLITLWRKTTLLPNGWFKRSRRVFNIDTYNSDCAVTTSTPCGWKHQKTKYGSYNKWKTDLWKTDLDESTWDQIYSLLFIVSDNILSSHSWKQSIQVVA